MANAIRFSKLKATLAALFFAVGMSSLFHYSNKLFELPMVDGYCIKPALHIGVATQMYNLGDPWLQHVPYQVDPKNWSGETWPIVAFDSPLTIVGLSSIFSALHPPDLESRIRIARYFALGHALATFIVLSAGFWLLADFFGALFVAPLFCGSFFVVYYSSRPFAEEYALFYQALFVMGGWCALNFLRDPRKKIAAFLGLAFLLCAGGKMNYFTIGAPMLFLLPEMDPGLSFLKRYRKRAVVALFVAALAALPILAMIKFPFGAMIRMFVFGNMAPVPGHYLSTFLTGFLALPSILRRTFGDYGAFVFVFGWVGLLRLFYLLGRRGLRGVSLYQRILIACAVGHALNYLVLRNLYIPHGYYLLPGFVVALLLAVDFWNGLLLSSSVRQTRAGQVLAAIFAALLVGLTMRSEVKQYRQYYSLRDYYQASLKAPSKLRQLTQPGDVIWAGNICFAFYTDRLAVVNPHREWINEYVRHGMRYYLGDPDPNMNHFFHILDKENQIYKLDEELVDTTH